MGASIAMLLAEGVDGDDAVHAWSSIGLGEKASLYAYYHQMVFDTRDFDGYFVVGERDSFWQSIESIWQKVREFGRIPAAVVYPDARLTEELSPETIDDHLKSLAWPPTLPLLMIDFHGARLGLPGPVAALESMYQIVLGSRELVTKKSAKLIYSRLTGRGDDDAWVMEAIIESSAYWTGESLVVWLASPSSLLDGARPIDVIEQRDKRIFEALEALDQGIYS